MVAKPVLSRWIPATHVSQGHMNANALANAFLVHQANCGTFGNLNRDGYENVKDITLSSTDCAVHNVLVLRGQACTTPSVATLSVLHASWAMVTTQRIEAAIRTAITFAFTFESPDRLLDRDRGNQLAVSQMQSALPPSSPSGLNVRSHCNAAHP